MCEMLTYKGHKVYHYGNEGSSMPCFEHIEILKKEEILPPNSFLKYDVNSQQYKDFERKAVDEINARIEINDFVLCAWSTHKNITDKLKDVIVIESGIGYPYGHFALYKVFESYAIMHAYYGLEAVGKADKFKWYDRVIPNCFDPEDFEYNETKGDYILFLGMRHGGIGKGFNVAVEVAQKTGLKLICAGPDAPTERHGGVEYVGPLDTVLRKQYLRDACCLIAPSLFLEPFCGVQVEAFASGTPVISTDWGAFAEYNIHGKTGFRCHTMKDFIGAVKAIRDGCIDPKACLAHATQFTLHNVADQYQHYFSEVMAIYNDKGWYSEC
jgi:glycosyltransferase involved in cell wall biosynthesis